MNTIAARRWRPSWSASSSLAVVTRPGPPRHRHRLASYYEVLEAQQELYPVIARGFWRDDKCGA